jgi:hypothetical protein
MPKRKIEFLHLAAVRAVSLTAHPRCRAGHTCDRVTHTCNKTDRDEKLSGSASVEPLIPTMTSTRAGPLREAAHDTSRPLGGPRAVCVLRFAWRLQSEHRPLRRARFGIHRGEGLILSLENKSELHAEVAVAHPELQVALCRTAGGVNVELGNSFPGTGSRT